MKQLVANVVVVGILVGAASAIAIARARGQGLEQDPWPQLIDQQIRTGRSVTARIERDPRASADAKQKAAQLDQLLDTRERMVTRLDSLYRDFLTQHKADLDELHDLRKRALVLDQQLDKARTALMKTNRADLDDLKRSAQQARQMVEGLRNAYDSDRRTRRQR